MEATSTGARGAQGLGPWVCGPLLGLVVLLTAIADLPGVDCGESRPDGSSRETLLVVVTALASVATVAASCWRLAVLRRQGRWRLSPWPVLVLAGLVLVCAAIGATEPRQLPGLLFAVFLAGLLLTALALLTLAVGWARGRSVDDVGLVVPLYLFGMGLLCYPAITSVALIFNSGALC
jgi:hypothetical protein